MNTLEDVRKKGRFGDTILAHINASEAALLKLAGGSGTINPETGLPEFFGFGDIGSFLTGGISDLFQGNKLGAGMGNAWSDLLGQSNAQTMQSVTGIPTFAGEDRNDGGTLLSNIMGPADSYFYGTSPLQVFGKKNEGTVDNLAHVAGLAYLGGAGVSALGGASGGAAGDLAATGSGAAMSGSEIAAGADVGAGLDSSLAATGAMNTAAAGGATASGGYNSDLAAAIKALQAGDQAGADAAMSRAAELTGAAGVGGAAGAAAGSETAPADQTLAPLNSYQFGGGQGNSGNMTINSAYPQSGLSTSSTYPVTADEIAAQTGKATAGAGAKSGGILSNLLGGNTGTLGKLMLAGTALNAAGNYMGAGQTNDNLEAYRNAAAWTPDRIASLTKGVDSSVLGIYGKNAADNKKTIAGNLASAGRGGGASESARRGLDIATKNASATARNNALMQAGVYTPPGQITGGGAYNEVNPYASTLTGASGALGNASNAMMTSEMLKKLYGSTAGMG